MPLKLENNYDCVSLMDLVSLREQGFSVLKSPHVGNQHPSNLVCGVLGIPLEMVTFTRGTLDQNFHPHVRIEGRKQTKLYEPHVWTPFAAVSSGQSATEYHQSSVKQLFPHTEIMTDMERMQQYPALAATVLRATNQAVRGVWYRQVLGYSRIRKLSQRRLRETDLETNVFQFSNDQLGWVVPNLVHIIFDFVYQSLSSGRDTVYHLSGPQMVQYVGGYKKELELMYDAVRQYIPALPLTLTTRIVPVAAARFVTVPDRVAGLELFASVRDQLDNPVVAQEFVSQFPEFTQPIESGSTVSQYDFSHMRDIKTDPWMLFALLSQVTAVHERLILNARLLSLQAAE